MIYHEHQDQIDRTKRILLHLWRARRSPSGLDDEKKAERLIERLAWAINSGNESLHECEDLVGTLGLPEDQVPPKSVPGEGYGMSLAERRQISGRRNLLDMIE